MSGDWNVTCLFQTHLSVPARQATHPHQPRGTVKGAGNTLGEEKGGAGPVMRSLHPVSKPPVRTTHLPSLFPPCLPTPPWSQLLSEATILEQTFLFLMCFKIFLPNEYLVCGLFCPRHIHLHFP